jgi:hypothetical protein
MLILYILFGGFLFLTYHKANAQLTATLDHKKLVQVPTYDYYGASPSTYNVTSMILAPIFSEEEPCLLKTNRTQQEAVAPNASIVLISWKAALHAQCTSVAHVSEQQWEHD